jgi:hypothetical protein
VPKLLIELSGTEYDRLVAYARSLRRTPNQQAAQLVADAMAELYETAAPLEGVEQRDGSAARAIAPPAPPQEASGA